MTLLSLISFVGETHRVGGWWMAGGRWQVAGGRSSTGRVPDMGVGEDGDVLHGFVVFLTGHQPRHGSRCSDISCAWTAACACIYDHWYTRFATALNTCLFSAGTCLPARRGPAHEVCIYLSKRKIILVFASQVLNFEIPCLFFFACLLPPTCALILDPNCEAKPHGFDRTCHDIYVLKMWRLLRDKAPMFIGLSRSC